MNQLTVALWKHRSGSILAQVMTCCLTAPRHYLNQYWLIIHTVLWKSPKGNININVHENNHYNSVENSTFKIKPHIQEVNELVWIVLSQDFTIMRTLFQIEQDIQTVMGHHAYKCLCYLSTNEYVSFWNDVCVNDGTYKKSVNIYTNCISWEFCKHS